MVTNPSSPGIFSKFGSCRWIARHILEKGQIRPILSTLQVVFILVVFFSTAGFLVHFCKQENSIGQLFKRRSVHNSSVYISKYFLIIFQDTIKHITGVIFFFLHQVRCFAFFFPSHNSITFPIRALVGQIFEKELNCIIMLLTKCFSYII